MSKEDLLNHDHQKALYSRSVWSDDRSSIEQILYLVKVLINLLHSTLFRLVIFRGNKIEYLRYRGVRIGKNCSILAKVDKFGSEPWLIELGNYVTITEGVHFITHDGSSRLFRHKIVGSSRFGNRFGPIKVHDNCFIGVNAIILPGVEIGPNSIVGAGSVVSGNVPPNSVVAGTPARQISSLDGYIENYKKKMIPIKSNNARQLRKELTELFWGEYR